MFMSSMNSNAVPAGRVVIDLGDHEIRCAAGTVLTVKRTHRQRAPDAPFKTRALTGVLAWIVIGAV